VKDRVRCRPLDHDRKREEAFKVKRVKLSFARGLEVEFTDRERALKQVKELAEKGTRFPIVVFGPEGCGKTAWLKQAAELLKEQGYEVIYSNPTTQLLQLISNY